LQILFKDKTIRLTCEKRTVATKLLGDVGAKKLAARLSEIEAALCVTDLERLTKPFDIPPTDERAGKRKERLMYVCSSFVSDAQPAKAVYPT
jgi:hypothetical protein